MRINIVIITKNSERDDDNSNGNYVTAISSCQFFATRSVFVRLPYLYYHGHGWYRTTDALIIVVASSIFGFKSSIVALLASRELKINIFLKGSKKSTITRPTFKGEVTMRKKLKTNLLSSW